MRYRDQFGMEVLVSFILTMAFMLPGYAHAATPVDREHDISTASQMSLTMVGGKDDPFTHGELVELSAQKDDQFLFLPAGNALELLITSRSGIIWGVDLSKGDNASLGPGKYLNIGQDVRGPTLGFSLHVPSQPSIPDAVSCPYGRSNIEILEWVIGKHDYLERLHLLFEQTCTPGKAPVSGELVIIRPRPPDLSLEAQVDLTARKDVAKGSLMVTGKVTCSKISQPRISGRVTQVVEGKVVTLTTTGTVNCVQGSSTSMLLVFDNASVLRESACRLNLELRASDRDSGIPIVIEIEEKIMISGHGIV